MWYVGVVGPLTRLSPVSIALQFIRVSFLFFLYPPPHFSLSEIA